MNRRLLLAAAAAFSVGVAVAAPVPKGPPPPAPKTSATLTLATAKMSGQFIQITRMLDVTEYIAVQEVLEQNGQQVVVTKTVPTTRQVPQTYQTTVEGTKATTADGQEILADDLTKKLGDGTAVVQAPAGMDPEWRKLFAADMIFLETKAVAQPVFGVGVGRAVPAIAPIAPALPLPPRAVPAQVVPLQLEKK